MTQYIDICWTLFYSNTTFDFIDYVVKERQPADMAKYIRLKGWHKTRLGHLLNMAAFKITGHDLYREYAISMLRGMGREEIEQLAGSFVATLQNRRIPQVWSLIDMTGHNILLSSTIEPVAKAVSALIHSSYLATELEYHNDICTGRILRDRLITKTGTLQDIERPFHVITDNLTDIDLIGQAEHSFIVTYGNRQRWESRLKKHRITGGITFIPARERRY